MQYLYKQAYENVLKISKEVAICRVVLRYIDVISHLLKKVPVIYRFKEI